MFLRSKENKGHEYLFLVENRWVNGRTKQEIVHYFGRRDKVNRDAMTRIIEHYKGIREVSPSETKLPFREVVRLRGENGGRIPLKGRKTRD